VLFDPLPFSAHSVTQVFAALENTLILLVIVLSLRELRCLPRACLRRPYTLVALLYGAAFVYAFAALGNLGLITRERTLLLPFLFVVLAIPLAEPGEVPYPWQRPRGEKRARPGERQVAQQAVASDGFGPYAEWGATARAERTPEPTGVGVEEWVRSDWVSEPYRTE
jgi:hypothetical protein